LPTALQAVAEVQDTPVSWVWTAADGLAVDWTDQLVPFHPSAKVTSREGPMNQPTAVQAVGDQHDTPFRWLYVAPVGLAVDSVDQLVPFQRSTNIVEPAKPTAVQADGDVHDTPLSWPDVAPGLGVGTIDQLVPSQRSANVPMSLRYGR
jgi:hypothetical protein